MTHQANFLNNIFIVSALVVFFSCTEKNTADEIVECAVFSDELTIYEQTRHFRYSLSKYVNHCVYQSATDTFGISWKAGKWLSFSNSKDTTILFPEDSMMCIFEGKRELVIRLVAEKIGTIDGGSYIFWSRNHQILMTKPIYWPAFVQYYTSKTKGSPIYLMIIANRDFFAPRRR